MAQQIEYPQYDGQPIPPPKHGEQTDNGVWADSRPVNNISDAWAAAHIPGCGVANCDYDWTDQVGAGDAQTRLTWHGEYGEWFCPRHYPQDSDETMSRAFAALADDIEAQYAADEQAAKAEDAQEWRDILDGYPPAGVWVEAEGKFGLLNKGARFTGKVRYIEPIAPPYDHKWQTEDGKTYWTGYLHIDHWKEAQR